MIKTTKKSIDSIEDQNNVTCNSSKTSEWSLKKMIGRLLNSGIWILDELPRKYK